MVELKVGQTWEFGNVRRKVIDFTSWNVWFEHYVRVRGKMTRWVNKQTARHYWNAWQEKATLVEDGK